MVALALLPVVVPMAQLLLELLADLRVLLLVAPMAAQLPVVAMAPMAAEAAGVQGGERPDVPEPRHDSHRFLQ